MNIIDSQLEQEYEEFYDNLIDTENNANCICYECDCFECTCDSDVDIDDCNCETVSTYDDCTCEYYNKTYNIDQTKYDISFHPDNIHNGVNAINECWWCNTLINNHMRDEVLAYLKRFNIPNTNINFYVHIRNDVYPTYNEYTD